MATVQSATSSSSADIFANLGLAKNGTAQAAGAMAETQDRFMKLLVTQIRNQDPLNPMDNAEMTSQLAQINTVNGIEKLNSALNRLVDFYQGGQAVQAADMIGKHVLVKGSDLQLTNAGGLAGFELTAPADQVKVSIKDGNGLLMRTLELGEAETGTGNFFWDGKTDAGESAAHGKYTFLIEATRGVDPVGSTPLSIGTVNAVTRTSGGFELDLGERGGVLFDDVRQIL